jgi:hypothetical protein
LSPTSIPAGDILIYQAIFIQVGALARNHRVKNHDFTPKNHIFSIAEGGAKMFEVFRVKNHDFTPKKSYFFQF